MMKARVLQSKLLKLGSELSDNSQQLGRLAVLAVLRIRDVYPRIRIFSIPDPGSTSKNLSIFNPKNCFKSSWKYDPGRSSRIADLEILPLPDPGSGGQKGIGSRIRIRNMLS
jgi:hypothetical protein